jgi:hypothetical protein
VKTIQINLGVTEVAEQPGSFAQIHSATKIRILFFYPSIVRCSQEEEDRQLEKPHSTPNSFRLSALHITGLDPESTAAVYPGYITERRTQRMVEPKCPECSTGGKRHIVAEESDLESKHGDPWFEIVYCDQCGHVYGVFPKLVLARNVPSIPKI